MNRLAIAVSVACGTLASLASASASADSLAPGDERFKFVAGWFLPAFNTDVRIDNTGTEGDDVDLGDDLGMDRDQSGALVGFEWRMAERHRLGASWSSFSQTATRTIDEQITIGDEVYPVNAEIRTKWSIDLIPITYSYSFLKSDKNELAGTFGIHWDKISLSLNGSTSLSDDDITASTSHIGRPAVAAHRPALRPPFLGQLVRGHSADRTSRSSSARTRSRPAARSTTSAHTRNTGSRAVTGQDSQSMLSGSISRPTSRA